MNLLQEQQIRRAMRSILTIGISYLAFSLLWILWSDEVLHGLISDPATLKAWQTRKGVAFVIASTGLLLLLLWREAARLARLDDDWRAIVDRAREGFWLIGGDGRTRVVNRSLAELLGRTRADLVGRRAVDLVAPGSRERIQAILNTASGRETPASPVSHELELQGCDGTPVPVLLHVTGLGDRTGGGTACYAFVTDLSALRAYQRELELIREGLENTFDEIFRISPDGHILDANQTACDRLGYRRDELVGLTVADIDPDFPASSRPGHWERLKAQGSLFFETYHRRKDGSRFPVEVGLTYFRYQGAEYDLAVARDITERKAAEASSERYRRALLALSRGNSALVHAQDERSLFEGVCKALTESHDYPQACVYLPPEETGGRPCIAAASAASGANSGPGGASAATVNGGGAAGNGLDALARRALVSGRIEVGHARDRRGPALIALPIHSDGELIGSLTIQSAESQAFPGEERALFEELAADTGFGVHTLRIRAQRDRQIEQLRLAGEVFENMREGLLITDARARAQAVNPAFTRITGYAEEEAPGGTPASLLKSGLQDDEFYAAMWRTLNTRGHWQGEIHNRRRDGEIYPAWLTISEVRDESGDLTHYVAAIADISESRELEAKLADRTYRDPLTGLPNRALFLERVEQALAMVHGDTSAAIAMLDLRGFRVLNESLGSSGGDRVLREIGSRLAAELADGDTVARPGSDEFWLLIHQTERTGAVRRRVHAALEIIGRPMDIDGQTITLEARAGVAVAPQDGTDALDLLNAGSTALHWAQVENESIRFFEPLMQERSRRRMRLEEALKVALHRDEIEVWYQPQVELATGAIIAVEALARWRSREWGLVSPGEFIPIAEETGLINKLGEHVLTVAARQAARWQAGGLPVRHVAVNVAAKQLEQPGWDAKVQSLLEEAGCAASWIELEITEQGVLGDIERTVGVLEALKARGLRTAIDDFGTGYSSLAYLKRLPLDILKIDKTFIDGLPGTENDRSIVLAILAVADTLGLCVVAEGVETIEQANWLREQGVSLAQGFLFARPDLPEGLSFANTLADGGKM